MYELKGKLEDGGSRGRPQYRRLPLVYSFEEEDNDSDCSLFEITDQVKMICNRIIIYNCKPWLYSH